MPLETSTPVHIVGSVPLASATEVFEQLGSALGSQLKRIPDGETGSRLNWIMSQVEPIKSASNLEVGGERKMGGLKNSRYQVALGKNPEDVTFPPLGYASNAISSFSIFSKLKGEGRLPKNIRFQVCLPTPLAVVYGFFIESDVKRIWPVYEKKLFQELDEILAAIPHRELAIQWDVCPEVHSFLEDPELMKRYSFEEVKQSLVRLCHRVPDDAELGLHFCYGDAGHMHNREPRDAGTMTKLFNAVVADLARPLTWIHMPVPKDRSDDAYFAPLSGLNLPNETELYIGLIHFSDGLDGAKGRIAAATRYLKKFGVATECGFGRRPPETIPALLELHRSVSHQVSRQTEEGERS